MTTKTALTTVLLLLIAHCITANGQPLGSTNDLWDISHGVTVVRHSPLNHCSANPTLPLFDIRAMFGGVNSMGDCHPEEAYSCIFQDASPEGFVHFVEWRTVAPITLRSFDLYAASDYPANNGSRAFASFTLKAKSPGSDTFDLLLYTFRPNLPSTNQLQVSANIPTTTAQDFRAEFVNKTGVPYAGPRVMELDGFGERRNFRTAIQVSCVDVCWTSVTNVLYQVQYSSERTTNRWIALTSAIPGTGDEQCFSDSIKGDPTRLYRVVELP